MIRAALLSALAVVSCMIVDCRAEQTSVPSPRPVQYVTIQGDRLELFAWAGDRTAYLTPSTDLDPHVMARLLSVFDQVYDYYLRATGRQPAKYKTYAGRDTVATVQETCGAGCG